MKKTTIPWLFAASLLLTACGETIAPSPSSTIPSSISSSQPTDVKSFIRETILSMANGKPSRMIYRKRSFTTGWSSNGEKILRRKCLI